MKLEDVIKIRKVIISWILVVIWASLIFIMSSMDTNESNSKSKKTLNEIVEKTVETTNGMGITDKHPTENKLNDVINKLNHPFRKVAHASEYLIFSILLLIALKNSGVNGIKLFILTIVICFVYACTDEYHQTFVNGRTGQFVDVIIDTIGAFIGSLLYGLNIRLKKKSIILK